MAIVTKKCYFSYTPIESLFHFFSSIATQGGDKILLKLWNCPDSPRLMKNLIKEIFETLESNGYKNPCST